MGIDSIPPINKILSSEIETPLDIIKVIPASSQAAEQQIMVHRKNMKKKVAGLLQSISKNELNDQVLRKIPSDEYMALLKLIDLMLSGSVDKEV